ncbi:hypothetical protein NQZ79_g5892 [Umbelopsis isabellina]|nr:hypothetical protein NQZ79_g5892 [Umbelopsis isabellina]
MPDIQPLTEDVAQIKDILIGTNEQQMEEEQANFVQIFEPKITREAEFVKQYKNLTESDKLHDSIKESLEHELASLCQQAKTSADAVQDVHDEMTTYKEEKARKGDTWDTLKEKHMADIAAQQRAFDLQHQKELDKLEEKYAKLTRDSIYANLVGGNTWKYQ